MSDTASVSLEILIERDRQKLVEGWTPEHDDRHTCNELAAAAAHYAHPTIDLWPTAWDRSWDKTTKHPRRKQLVIAAALIIAEIERLDRKKELQPAMQAAGCQDDDADELYSLAEYLEADDQARLRMLQDAWKTSTNDRQRAFFEGQMMGITVDMDEHPEWFDNACLCAECRSYA